MTQPTEMPVFLCELSFAFLDACDDLETLSRVLNSNMLQTLKPPNVEKTIQKQARQAWMLIHLTAAAFSEGWLSSEAVDEIVMNNLRDSQRRRGFTEEQILSAFRRWRKELDDHAKCWRGVKGDVGDNKDFDLLKTLKGETKS